MSEKLTSEELDTLANNFHLYATDATRTRLIAAIRDLTARLEKLEQFHERAMEALTYTVEEPDGNFLFCNLCNCSLASDGDDCPIHPALALGREITKP
jgi:hypothetical protein